MAFTTDAARFLPILRCGKGTYEIREAEGFGFDLGIIFNISKQVAPLSPLITTAALAHTCSHTTLLDVSEKKRKYRLT